MIKKVITIVSSLKPKFSGKRKLVAIGTSVKTDVSKSL